MSSDKSTNKTFQEWAKEMSISKEEADEIYKRRDPSKAHELYADCDKKAIDRNGIPDCYVQED